MKTAKIKRRNSKTHSERAPNYAQLLEQLDSLPERGPVQCPVDGCTYVSPKRHGVRVHMARKHSGKSWGRPFTVNGGPTREKALRKKPGKLPLESAHGVNFCPCCGFSLTVLRAAMSVAGGGR